MSVSKQPSYFGHNAPAILVAAPPRRVHRRLNMSSAFPPSPRQKTSRLRSHPGARFSQPIPPRFVRGVELCADLSVSASLGEWPSSLAHPPAAPGLLLVIARCYPE